MTDERFSGFPAGKVRFSRIPSEERFARPPYIVFARSIATRSGANGRSNLQRGSQ